MSDYEIQDPFLKEIDTYTGNAERHTTYSITLGALVEDGVFNWDKSYLTWKDAAYSDAQYTRLCGYFIKRFYYDEIAILPIKEWCNQLQRRLAYELMPKYRPLYKRVEEGINPLQTGDEWHKRRTIESEYPETLLSGNSDYISNGTDEEYETVNEGNISLMNDFMKWYRDIDKLVCDELELLFVQVYTTNVNMF